MGLELPNNITFGGGLEADWKRFEKIEQGKSFTDRMVKWKVMTEEAYLSNPEAYKKLGLRTRMWNAGKSFFWTCAVHTWSPLKYRSEKAFYAEFNEFRKKPVLIVVDEQNDFILREAPLGSRTDQEFEARMNQIDDINALATSGKFGLVVFTRDSHPADGIHSSFRECHDANDIKDNMVKMQGVDNQGKFVMYDAPVFPRHCVEGTPGAEFHERLNMRMRHIVVKKGQDRNVDSFGGFRDNKAARDQGKDIGLYAVLKRMVRAVEVFTSGLCTDYCVKETSLQALDIETEGHPKGKNPFQTVFLEKMSRPAELQNGDGARAIQAMQTAGVNIFSGTAQELLDNLRSPRKVGAA